MSFVANKIVQYIDADGEVVDVTERTPLPVSEEDVSLVLLRDILEESKKTNQYLQIIAGYPLIDLTDRSN